MDPSTSIRTLNSETSRPNHDPTRIFHSDVLTWIKDPDVNDQITDPGDPGRTSDPDVPDWTSDPNTVDRISDPDDLGRSADSEVPGRILTLDVHNKTVTPPGSSTQEPTVIPRHLLPDLGPRYPDQTVIPSGPPY